MKQFIKTLAQKMDKPYLFAFLVLLVGAGLLSINFFQHRQTITAQLLNLSAIALLCLAFFFYSLWRVNQLKGWVHTWSTRPLWVFLTFILCPLFLILLWNSPLADNQLMAELSRPLGSYRMPHFLFIYGWQALVFGTAFWAHPERKSFKFRLSLKDSLSGIVLGLGGWSLSMFVNEIGLRIVPAALPTQATTPMLWAILPTALVFMPLTTGFYFFHALPMDTRELHPLLSALAGILFFTLLPLRIISILPAFCLSLLLYTARHKTGTPVSLMLAYAVFNACLLTLNWQWVL
jgi:hypothetical protein